MLSTTLCTVRKSLIYISAAKHGPTPDVVAHGVGGVIAGEVGQVVAVGPPVPSDTEEDPPC